MITDAWEICQQNLICLLYVICLLMNCVWMEHNLSIYIFIIQIYLLKCAVDRGCCSFVINSLNKFITQQF